MSSALNSEIANDRCQIPVLSSVNDKSRTLSAAEELLASVHQSADKLSLTPKQQEEIKASIREQIEFYFGDANLPTDNFLLKQLKNPKNMTSEGVGRVQIATVASFNKIKKLSRDINLIVEALNDSKLLIVSNCKKYIQRSVPIPAEWLDISVRKRRCCRVDSLPADISIASLTKLFQKHGKIALVRINNGSHNNVLGRYGIVEFETEQEAIACVRSFQPKRDSNSSWRRGPAKTSSLKVSWLERKRLPRKKKSENGRSSEDENSKDNGKKNKSVPEKKGNWAFDAEKGMYVAQNDDAKAIMNQIVEESKEMGWGSRFKPREKTSRRPRLQLKKRGSETLNDDGADTGFMKYAKGPNDTRMFHPDGSPGFALIRQNKQ